MEFDENGNEVKYRSVVTLRKKTFSNPVRANASDSAAPKLYDIGQLQLEKYHKVLHDLALKCKEREPIYTQQTNEDLNGDGIVSPVQEEETKDIDQEDVQVPVRDDFQDDELVDDMLEESKKLNSAHELTLGKSDLASGGALIVGEGDIVEGMKSSRGPETQNVQN